MSDAGMQRRTQSKVNQHDPSSRPSWADYLAPRKPGNEPTPTLNGALLLEPDPIWGERTGEAGTEGSPHRSGSHPSVSPASVAPPAIAAAQNGPFAVPDVMPMAAVELRVSRFKLAMIGLMMVSYVIATALPQPPLQHMARAESIYEVKPEQYARYEVPPADAAAIRWIVQKGRKMVVGGHPGWDIQTDEQKITQLQHLNALGENPTEIKVVSPQSQLLAEVNHGKYTLY